MRWVSRTKRNGKWSGAMKRLLFSVPLALAMIVPSVPSIAQVAGSSELGVATVELKDVVNGWSAKRQILGQHVYNDKNEEVGTIEDIIISPERSASYAIVGAGGFLGIGTHDVAIPASQLKLQNDRLVLAGATKEALRAMPAFHYAPR